MATKWPSDWCNDVEKSGYTTNCFWGGDLNLNEFYVLVFFIQYNYDNLILNIIFFDWHATKPRIIAIFICTNFAHYISNWPRSCLSGNAVQDMCAVFNTNICGIFWGFAAGACAALQQVAPPWRQFHFTNSCSTHASRSVRSLSLA